MQAQAGYEGRNAIRSTIETLKTQGIYGLYRGSVPQFIGSMVFRSAQFGAYVSVFNRLDNRWGRSEIPGTHGLQLRVIAGGLAAGISRAIFEAPLDYWKIRLQIVKGWTLRDALLRPGFGVTLLRGSLLLTIFFIYFDSARRHTKNLFENPIGTFIITGTCTTAAWVTVWPLEYMKSQVQGGYGDKDQPLFQRMKGIIHSKGFFGLYRGIGPGCVRSFIANGVSMVVMKWVSENLTNMLMKEKSMHM